MANGRAGFVDYYLWYSQGVLTRSSLPFTKVFLYLPPNDVNIDASEGNVLTPLGNSDCIGKV